MCLNNYARVIPENVKPTDKPDSDLMQSVPVVKHNTCRISSLLQSIFQFKEECHPFVIFIRDDAIYSDSHKIVSPVRYTIYVAENVLFAKWFARGIHLTNTIFLKFNA